MSERPNVVLCLLLSAASAVAVLVGISLATLGGTGVAELVTMVVGVFSACVFFLAELGRVPFAALVVVGLVLASAVAFLRTVGAYAREQRVLRALPLERVEQGPLADLAQRAGIRWLYLSPARRPAAFCFGLLRTRVVLTSGLLDRLAEDERVALIWHEARHASSREPLKCLLARLAANTFFWIPALRDLLDRYLLVKELEADRLAVRRTSRAALAGALCEVVGEPGPAAAVGIADYASVRIERLLEPGARLPALFTRSRLVVSLLGAVSLGLLLELPLRLDLGETARLRPMLTTMSFHGLPGMAGGLGANMAALALAACLTRRLVLKRLRPPQAR